MSQRHHIEMNIPESFTKSHRNRVGPGGNGMWSYFGNISLAIRGRVFDKKTNSLYLSIIENSIENFIHYEQTQQKQFKINKDELLRNLDKGIVFYDINFSVIGLVIKGNMKKKGLLYSKVDNYISPAEDRSGITFIWVHPDFRRGNLGRYFIKCISEPLPSDQRLLCTKPFSEQGESFINYIYQKNSPFGINCFSQISKPKFEKKHS
ncbi:MAG: hypothetical protein KDK51_02360 [Deltaproteobacteria bacterium]|nr:hypothetical protein [Deltaproteobacteria bacterium]